MAWVQKKWFSRLFLFGLADHADACRLVTQTCTACSFRCTFFVYVHKHESICLKNLNLIFNLLNSLMIYQKFAARKI